MSLEGWEKQPAGWGTALAVKQISKKKVSGAVAPCIFGTWNGLKFCRAKWGSFQYLQCFQCLKGCSPFLFFFRFQDFKRRLKALPVTAKKSLQCPLRHLHCHMRMPCSNCGLTTPFLRVLHELEMAPLEIFHIPSIPPVCTSNWPHFFSSWYKRCLCCDCTLRDSKFFQMPISDNTIPTPPHPTPPHPTPSCQKPSKDLVA